MHFIDSHCHIHFPAYHHDITEVLDRARAAGVAMITVGTEASTSEAAVAFAQQHDDVWATIGLHPGHVCDQDFVDENEFHLDHFPDAQHRGQVFDEARFAALVIHPKVVAIGECGLDYYRLGEKSEEHREAEKKAQQHALRSQLAFASRFDKPVVIHCRPGATLETNMAHADQVQLMREEIVRGGLTRRGVIHCFTGTVEEALVYAELGFYVSFPGIVTFGKNVMEVARAVPLHHMLIETDAPYLTPAPHRGQRNEPAHVTLVAQKIAEIKNISLDEVARATTTNAYKLFGL